ncbi:MAG: hypothetical protein EON58_16785 [Alphaproteobacteria bacterium]|nr:MAG: hypothetical protein EON58_16785 [Alphaproteobacteria bacterium]
MNSAPFPELFQEATSGVVPYELLSRISEETSTPAPEIVDALSIYVARAYADGKLSFEEGDRVMNAIFSASVSEKFWADYDRTVPPTMLAVYQAFDAGEYFHEGDDMCTHPEVKYTRPLIEKLLAERSRDAQPIAAADGYAGR